MGGWLYRGDVGKFMFAVVLPIATTAAAVARRGVRIKATTQAERWIYRGFVLSGSGSKHTMYRKKKGSPNSLFPMIMRDAFLFLIILTVDMVKADAWMVVH